MTKISSTHFRQIILVSSVVALRWATAPHVAILLVEMLISRPVQREPSRLNFADSKSARRKRARSANCGSLSVPCRLCRRNSIKKRSVSPVMPCCASLSSSSVAQPHHLAPSPVARPWRGSQPSLVIHFASHRSICVRPPWRHVAP